MSINYEETKVKKKRLHTLPSLNQSIFYILAKMQRLQKYRHIEKLPTITLDEIITDTKWVSQEFWFSDSFTLLERYLEVFQ